MQLLKKSIKVERQKTRKLRFWGRVLIPFFIGFLLHAAYRWPWCLGWLVIFLWPFLFYFSFEWFLPLDFCLCLISFFTLHFWWIFLFLRAEGKGNLLLHFCLFAVIVLVYFLVLGSLFLLVYFLVQRTSCRITRLTGVLVLSTSFILAERWGGSFGGAVLGYPLLHPVLPLLSFYDFCCADKKGSVFVVPMRPGSSSVESLYHALEGALRSPLKSDGGRVFVTPELAIEDDLFLRHEKMVHVVTLLGPDDFLCVGALKEQEGKVGHAVYIYNQQGLLESFEKECLVPFYEYVPWCFKKYRWASELFLANKNHFVHGKRKKNELPFECFICADFFLKPLTRSNRSNLFFILMNDKCLPDFVVDLLLVYAEWKCFKEGATGFCIGWNNSLKIF